MNVIQPPQSYANDLSSGHPNETNATSYPYPMSTSQFRPQDPAYSYNSYVLQEPVTDLPYYPINNTSVLNTFTPSLPKAPDTNSHPHPLVLDALEGTLRSKTREGVSERTVQLVMHFFRQNVASVSPDLSSAPGLCHD
ncbi:hypothetical protein DSO57_1024467 [Entomophthora muscae]|uniref:Uncharacterized protein n=1 Tax=Entomophthora muscae TaxID=34485 RepID=A0ACC2RTW5_9FUNG|nr:hypothetical protein DSO57_1024467 [Entomophthora muscae]